MANDLTTYEKVDVVIAGAGASGSTFAAVLAKAGKKVVLIDNGPDWQLTDLISSDIWGRRIKPAGPPFILEGKVVAPIGYHGGWGVGGAALHWFANVPRLLPNDFKIKSEHTAPTTGRSPTRTWRRGTTRSRTTSASRGTPRPRRCGARSAATIRCRR
jgi:choline dehydrogenase-like flavoprotein